MLWGLAWIFHTSRVGAPVLALVTTHICLLPGLEPRHGYGMRRCSERRGSGIVPSGDAKGVLHTSPGQRPGFIARCSNAGQRPASYDRGQRLKSRSGQSTRSRVRSPLPNETRFQRSESGWGHEPRAVALGWYKSGLRPEGQWGGAQEDLCDSAEDVGNDKGFSRLIAVGGHGRGPFSTPDTRTP